MKILIALPSFKILGGVANHYMGLSPHWTKKIIYSTYGKRVKIPAWICLLPDLILYVLRIILYNPKVVIVNPSLRNYQLLRDGVYLIIAKMFRKEIITFIHGWDSNKILEIQKRPFWFKSVYGKSKFIYVLSSEFKKDLDKLGLKSKVILTSTKVANNLLDDFKIEEKPCKINQILFLARVEHSKGIIIALDAFRDLKVKYPHLKLSVCGTGKALADAYNYVEEKGISDVSFNGNVSGPELIKQFTDSDIYILPTTHGEGMATSVLEAMAFGLPIISRPVGGVKDFFINGEMGYLLESFNFKDYASVVEEFINNRDLVRRTSLINHEYALKHFLASEVTKQIELDIKHYCE